ncbi:hypothetical protein [Acinetobacter johnsonii]|uniref:Phage gp6-like head-tail connector protein n=1 Tax=Acinetobacter johnsonii TaxID=40214 RepID=A0AAJ6LA69_ACIJO|nr:hypothetical protein [Acinetobacter johnsonii]ALV73085.1 hypothetical protein RZ95_09365 [Acinetobacter johnsonii XBB1]MDH1532925.1 hypothetical protein [Acinetobacter johnsonii]WMG17632.1 hypothetical protein QBJ73_14815 [Acinetobacter johnsonii]
MSFITQEQAEQILGVDFAPVGDKARLIKLANTWMRNEVGYVPDPIDSLLIDAACEIIKGIIAGVIYAGIARQTTSESVKADTVQVTESFAEGSVEISEFEQIALAFIDSLNLKPKGFGFEVFRA